MRVDYLTKEAISHDCRVGDFVIWKQTSQFTVCIFNLKSSFLVSFV